MTGCDNFLSASIEPQTSQLLAWAMTAVAGFGKDGLRLPAYSVILRGTLPLKQQGGDAASEGQGLEARRHSQLAVIVALTGAGRDLSKTREKLAYRARTALRA